MWFDKLLTTQRKLEGRIISFIDQPDMVKKILQYLEKPLTAIGRHLSSSVRKPRGS
jgi:hypothetical protein